MELEHAKPDGAGYAMLYADPLACLGEHVLVS